MTITQEITSRELAAQYTAVVRGEMPAVQMGAWLAWVFQAVHDYLARTGVRPAGPPFARFTFLREVVAVEAGFPVPREVAGDGPVEPSMLPAGVAAVASHVGPYEELDGVYRAVHDWLTDRGLAPAGPHWEIYYTDPITEPDPARWRTDVVVRYRT